jgi:hypothetical protein
MNGHNSTVWGKLLQRILSHDQPYLVGQITIDAICGIDRNLILLINNLILDLV